MKVLSKRTFALARKEIVSWLYAPAFYGIAVFFLLFVSIWFYFLQQFFALNAATLQPFFTAFPIAYILVVPVLTMKSWAEEKKLGSMELLLTMPFSDWELVMGKFISSFIILAALLVLTLPVPLSLIPLGTFDAGVIIAEYLGSLLLGAAAIAVGLFLSALSKNQAAAFLSSAVVLLIVTMISAFTQGVTLPAPVSDFCNFISLNFHFDSFSDGLLDSRDILFFIFTAWLFLYLNTQALLFRKWR
jgi:ABC-2 type transport system permease protein